jgi:hypothetical protein
MRAVTSASSVTDSSRRSAASSRRSSASETAPISRSVAVRRSRLRSRASASADVFCACASCSAAARMEAASARAATRRASPFARNVRQTNHPAMSPPGIAEPTAQSHSINREDAGWAPGSRGRSGRSDSYNDPETQRQRPASQD